MDDVGVVSIVVGSVVVAVDVDDIMCVRVCALARMPLSEVF